MPSLVVALAQLNIRFEDKVVNRIACESVIVRAVRQGAEVVVFPEMTLTGFSMRARFTGENAKFSETVEFFSTLAKQYRVHVIFGVVFFEKGKGRNMAVVVDQRGIVIAQYQKVHCFSFVNEDRHFREGTAPTFFTIKNVLCSLAICYDLRFPGLFEAIATRAPSVIFVIANWPSLRIAQWDALLKARALDCAAAVVGVNRVGGGDGQSYPGHSSVYGPNGERLINIGHATLRTCRIDCDAVKVHRMRFPSLRDKRRSLYAQLLLQ